MATTTTRLGLKVIDTPAVDTVAELRQSINNHATILDAQYIESTYALRPAAASKGRVHRSTDTGEIAIDTGAAWEPLWGPPSLSRSVLEVGQVGQTRAGRQLVVADFTDCGLPAPVGLWNLGDLTDVSGNSRTLSNKGTVTFGVGIEGAASSAAVFSGSTAQGLYIADVGAGDPFRIKTGSVACWMRTAKRGQTQTLISKNGATFGANTAFLLTALTSNRAGFTISKDGGSTNVADVAGVTDVADDRWHFIVGTYDGQTARVYVDGQLEGVANMAGGSGAIFGSAEPFNIGARDADGSTAGALPHFGRVDEAFVSAEVLSLEQVRHLYGVKLAHGLPVQPRRASLRVTRRRRGAALANGDFPSNPVRAHNFAAGALTDLNGGTAVTASGTPATVAGPDGVKDSALSLSGSAFLQATDTGLPSGTSDRSYGLWFNSGAIANQNLMGWANNGIRMYLNATSGTISSDSGADAIAGPMVSDGQWHHAVVTETNSPVDGLKRRLYVDGKVVATSTVLNAITLVGANGLRIGANAAGGSTLQGSVSRAFVHAGVLTPEQVLALYQKVGSAGALQPSPKDAPDHIEGLWPNSLIFIGDDLDSSALIDVEVSR